jgi:hypothetical protein
VLRWSAVAPTCSGDAGQALHVASSPGTPTPGLEPGSSSLPAGLAPAGVAHSDIVKGGKFLKSSKRINLLVLCLIWVFRAICKVRYFLCL